MAITKLLRIKETKRGSRSSHLKNNLAYICNPEKTSGGCWVGGNAGTTPEIIYRTMMMNKNYRGKEGGTQGFHYVISFPPELNIDESMAYRITEEFCEGLLGDSFYYCITVHNDKEHLHTHITFDSVSKTDGYKFHSPKGDWEKRIQPITDRICAKYGIPILEYFKEETRGMDYGSWTDGKTKDIRQRKRNRKSVDYESDNHKMQNPNELSANGHNNDLENESYKGTGVGFKKENIDNSKYSWYDIIRDDIDEAIEASDSYDEFIRYLKGMHYEIRDKKYLSLCPFGKERFVRTMRLGEEYGKDKIRERIAGEKAGAEFKRYGNYEELIMMMMDTYREQHGDPTAFQKGFYYQYVCTMNIRHSEFYENWKYKKEILELHQYNLRLNYGLGVKSNYAERKVL